VPELDDFNQATVRRQTAQHQPLRHQLFAIGIVEFVAMPMAFTDFIHAVHLVRKRSFPQLAEVTPQTHRATFRTHTMLMVHEMDDRMGRPFVELCAIGAGQASDIPCKLNCRALHTETESQKRNLAFASVPDGGNFAFNSPRSEPAWNQDPVRFAENPFSPLPFDILRLDPIDVYTGLMVDTTMHQCFRQALITFLESCIFPDERHRNLMFGMFDFLDHGIPFPEVRRTGL